MDDQTNGRVGAKVVDIPVRRIDVGGVLPVGKEKNGIAVIVSESSVVDGPVQMTGVVNGRIYTQIHGRCWSFHWYWEYWSGFIKGVLKGKKSAVLFR